MKYINCTFYRPEHINLKEFENIIGKLSYDLYRLESEQLDEWSVYCYFEALSRHAKPLEKNPNMRFLGLANPREMPSDARVDFFYRPTYIATAFMMKAVLLFPSLMDKEEFLDSDRDFTVNDVIQTLKGCMLGCTGREFDGAGALPLKDCIKLFESAGADEFLDKYPELCPEFTELYRERKAFVSSGRIDPREAWYHHGH